jgi:hypothetical protein
MTTRYKTPGEIAGVKRRIASYVARQQGLGRKKRTLWANDDEILKLRAVLEIWRTDGQSVQAAV